MNRELITAPVDTPLSLAEVKEHIFVEHTDDDTLITAYLNQAIDFCEIHTGMRFMPQTWRYFFDPVEVSEELKVPEPVVSSVSAVNYLTGTAVPYTVNLLDAAEYEVDTGNHYTRLKLLNGLPVFSDTYNAFYLDVVAGYADAASVPDAIKTALYLIVGHLYKNRESVIVGTIASVLPMGALDFLSKYRVYNL